MERMSSQTMPPRKAYAAPRLKLYGSVLALTASGTGPVNEANLAGPNSTHAVTKCEHGITTWTPSMSTFKHCF